MMNNKVENRGKCNDSKKLAIKNALLATQLRRQNQVIRYYECKIVEKRLNKRQREELEQLFVEGKWFYNHVLNLHNDGQKLNAINTTNIKTVDHYDKDKNLIQSELKVLSGQQKQAILTRMVQNEKSIWSLVKKGYQKHGNLRFKSELTCIPLKQYGTTYKFKSSNKVKIQGIHGDILLRTGGQLQIADELANANLVKKPDGYYLKVVCFINKENWKTQKTNGREIGLDFGIKTNITTSEGQKIDVSIEESERLKKLQREMFRREKGSSNRYKTIKKIQREYQKIGNKKADMTNKIVHMLKQYDCIVMQDEQLSKWHKQKGMSKVVQHSCMGHIKQKLKLLPQTIVLDKYIPTTKWCPNCGKKHSIGLDERTYVCECGYHEDRDIHSAKNMLNIKNLVFKNKILVPTEYREVTLMEFKTSVKSTGSADVKLER